MQKITDQEITDLIGKDNPAILDVGAYDGNDSLRLANLFTSPRVYAFECDPRSQTLFKKTVNDDERIHLCHFALGSHAGVIDFFQSNSDTRRHEHNQDSWSASGSLRYPNAHLDLFPDVKFDSIIKVYCTTLDRWYCSISPNIVDWCHVDLNGAEGDFISGGFETLSERTRFLYIESSDMRLYEGQITKEQLLNMLPNFEVIGTYNDEGNFRNLLLRNRTI